MYYRKKIDDSRRIKLYYETRNKYSGGAYFDEEKGYWKKYRIHQYKAINKAERSANKKIRRYRETILNGKHYRKLTNDIDSCY